MRLFHQTTDEKGFSLIELLVAATVFTFVMAGVSSLFVSAMDIQRRATSIQKIDENVQFVMESISREVRVSTIDTSVMGDTNCNPVDPVATTQLVINHPVNGTVRYLYQKDPSGFGAIFRNGQRITTTDVDFKSFAFCVSGSGADGKQTRVTIPMTVQASAGRPSTQVSVQLQTTVVSRDLGTDLSR